MSDEWKRFFGVLAAVVGAILAALAGFLSGRFGAVRGKDRTPEDIAREAQARIEETKQAIKADSDQALADRFNTIAKKEEKKG